MGCLQSPFEILLVINDGGVIVVLIGRLERLVCLLFLLVSYQFVTSTLRSVALLHGCCACFLLVVAANADEITTFGHLLVGAMEACWLIALIYRRLDCRCTADPTDTLYDRRCLRAIILDVREDIVILNHAFARVDDQRHVFFFTSGVSRRECCNLI